MTARHRISLVGIAISILAGIISSVLVVGRQARLPDVLAVFFFGFAGGASLVSLIRGGSK